MTQRRNARPTPAMERDIPSSIFYGLSGSLKSSASASLSARKDASASISPRRFSDVVVICPT